MFTMWEIFNEKYFKSSNSGYIVLLFMCPDFYQFYVIGFINSLLCIIIAYFYKFIFSNIAPFDFYYISVLFLL